MRRWIIFLLVGIVMAQSFYNLGVTAYWLTHRAYITATLCENKDKPELQCDGKCYLNKKIAEPVSNATKEQESKQPNLEKGLELADCHAFSYWELMAKEPNNRSKSVAGQQDMRHTTVAQAVFHPPPSLMA